MFELLRNPTVIATFISLGFHGLLGLTTPVLVGSFSSKNDDGKNGVGVVKLSTIEQNRIPGLGPNSDTLSAIPRLTLPSNKPKALPSIPPLNSLQIPSISPNPNLNLNPSQNNIISSQNKSAIKIPSNPNIPPINVEQPKTFEPKLEPLPNVTLPDISSINRRKNRSEQPQQLADTKSASKPDRKSSEKNPAKNDFLSRNNNLREPDEMNVYNDVKPQGKIPSSKNKQPNIKPQKNNNDELAFNKIPVNPNQDPRLLDEPSFPQPEESSENKPEKKNQDSDIIKEDNLTNNNPSETKPKPTKKHPKAEINMTKDDTNTEIEKTQNSNNSETNKPKKPDKNVNTINKKKPKNKQKIARNTPNNRGIPTFGNDNPPDTSQFDINKTQPTQPYDVANNGVDITPPKKPEFPERLIADNNTNRHDFAYNRTGTTEREGYTKYEYWATKYNPNYSHIEKHSFTSSNYPKDACIKQLQGNVAIAVLVDPNGKIKDETAEIMISSGYRILNDQAIKDVKKIKLENQTDKPKPYYVEVNFKYPEKRCPQLTINNKTETQVKQSEENYDMPPQNEKKGSKKTQVKQSEENHDIPPQKEKEVSKKTDENNPLKLEQNERENIERVHEQNTEHSEQNLERKPK